MKRLIIPPWLSYVAPFILFLALTSIEAFVPKHIYPYIYTVKIVLVGLVTWFFWPRMPQQARMPAPGLFLSTVLGVLLTVVWVVVDQHTPHFKFLGSREGYNPYNLKNDGLVFAFMGIRFFGLVCIVPFIEEVFYRGFLLHYVVAPDNFERIPTGVLTNASVAINVIAFALTHPEWISAAIFAAAMCFLLYKTQDLRNCILAHAITNLLLGLFVVMTGQWKYW
jgi:CAAX prenyl protease-like protein